MLSYVERCVDVEAVPGASAMRMFMQGGGRLCVWGVEAGKVSMEAAVGLLEHKEPLVDLVHLL